MVGAPGSEVFSRIYADNVWGKGSGVGSLPESVREYVTMLEAFLSEQHINSIVDFGCGDWQFSQSVDWGERTYLGVDVVQSVIDANRAAFSSETKSFALMTNVEALPPSDLLICKDVLQHLPNADVKTYLAAFKRKFKYILISNGADAPNVNVDIRHGEYRPLWLDHPPFEERCVTLLEWRVTAYGNNILMRTYLILGEPAKNDPMLRPGSPLYPPRVGVLRRVQRWSVAAAHALRTALSRSLIGRAWRRVKHIGR